MGRVNMKPEEQSSVQKCWGSSSNVRLFRERKKLNVDALVVYIICHQGMGRVNIKPEEQSSVQEYWGSGSTVRLLEKVKR